MKYYAIKRPDGSWIMGAPDKWKSSAWWNASIVDALLSSMINIHVDTKKAQAAGYRCVEVSGFVEVEK